MAVLLTGLVLLLNAMTASPSLHQWLHADAEKSDHQCAVTLFAHGNLDSAVVVCDAATPLNLVIAAEPASVFLIPPVAENLPAGRAPPACLFKS